MLFTVTKARIDLTLSPFMPPKDTCVIISKNIWKRFTMLRPREKGARQVKVAPIGLRKMVMVDGGEEEKATLANTPSKLITITGLIASPLKIFKKRMINPYFIVITLKRLPRAAFLFESISSALPSGLPLASSSSTKPMGLRTRREIGAVR